MPVPRTCERCGAAFRVDGRRVRRGGGRYCSLGCVGAAQTVRVARTCANPACGRAFAVIPSKVRDGGGRYCCRRCAAPFTTAAARERRWAGHGSALWQAAGEIDRRRAARATTSAGR